MSKLTYSIFCLISALFFTAVTIPAFADGQGSWEPGFPGGGGGTGGGGTGGGWGNSDGFGGSGGISGGSGGSGGSWGGSCVVTLEHSDFNGQTWDSPSSACSAIVGRNYSNSPTVSSSLSKLRDRLFCDGFRSDGSNNINVQVRTNGCTEPPKCDDGYSLDSNNQCKPDLQCPAGYEKQGNKCVWQCPAGMKLVGGSCVKDDQPEDCDPAIQECDEDGKPKCNICEKLTNIINNHSTNINNDNRVISLTETLVSNQNTTNNNLNTVNNNLNTINNNMSTINNNIQNIDNSVQELITTIQENNPTVDTTALENKIDEVINAINNNTGGGDGDGVPPDLQPIIDKMSELNQSIIDNRYDDTELKAKIDELINKDLDFSEITGRQDEQTGLLEDIKKLLMPTNEAGDPSFTPPEIETPETTDLWGAIRGFDIHQNRINATKQCPPDKEFEINLLTVSKTLAIPMGPMCDYASYLAPIFLMLAYFSGAMIILKAGD